MALGLPWLWLLPLDDPYMAHVRLGVFGFGGAAVTGYVLTAQKAGTHRDAPVPAPALVAAWALARLVALLWPAAWVASAALMAVVALAVIWPVLATPCWAWLPLALVPLILTGADVALIYGVLLPAHLPLGMGALILIIGGRSVPAFVDTERRRRGETPRDPGPAWPGLVVLLAGYALPGWWGVR